MSSKSLLADSVFTVLSKMDPHPKTELEFTNDFTLLVAVVLSAQATDVGVNKATKALFAVADTPQKMVALGEAKLKTYIKTIGLFNAKAKNVIALSEKLLKDFKGNIPEDVEALQSLPGVGRKTANVWLNCARGQPTVAVDTHVFRVSNRIGLAKASNVLETEKQLLKNIPKKWLLHAHHWLILHGRYVCKARAPMCRNCAIEGVCKYDAKLL